MLNKSDGSFESKYPSIPSIFLFKYLI